MWVPSWDCQPAPRTTFRITRTRHSPSLQQGRSAASSLHATARVNQTGNYDSPQPRSETCAIGHRCQPIFSRSDPTQQGRITAVCHEHSRQWERTAGRCGGPPGLCHRLEVAPSYFRSHGQEDHATNIQPDQRNRRINGWIEVLQAYPLVWRHLPVGLLSNRIYISSIQSNIRSNRTPVTKNHVLGYKKGGLCL